MFLEFDFVGGPFYKKTQFWLLIFTPPGPRGYRGALGVRRIKKLHKRENDRRPILAGVPFIKNVEIPKFLSAPRPAPPSGPVFSGRGPKLKIPLPTFCSPRCPNSEKVRHDPLTPKPPEEIDLAETCFFGVRAWPWGPRERSHPPQKLLARS